MLLLLFSLLVGYPSSLTLGSAMWGSSPTPYINLLALLGFFAAAVAFLAAIVIFLISAVAALTSAPASLPSDSAAPARAKLGSHEGLGLAAVESQGPLLALRCILFGIIAVDFYQVFTQTGWPSNSSSRHLFSICLIDQLPFLVTLQRTWKRPNPAGLVLILAASIEQILFVLVFSHDHNLSNPWGSVVLLLSFAAIGCVGWMWLRFTRLLPGFTVLTSIFLALAAYTFVLHFLLSLIWRWL